MKVDGDAGRRAIEHLTSPQLPSAFLFSHGEGKAHSMNHIQLLSERFGGALLVRPVVAGQVIAMAKPSVYNRVSAGTFPLPLVETPVGRMVRVTDIASYLDSLEPIMPIKVEREPKPKGRPTKVEQVEAQRRHLTVPELRAQRSLGV